MLINTFHDFVAVQEEAHPMTDRRGLIREQRELIAVDAVLVEVRHRPHPGRESDDTRLIEYNAIKNEIVVAMLKWDGNVPELARELVAMYGNVKMDGMWRNYCVQFLGQIFGKIHDPDSRAAALDVFENALAAPSGGMAGTALIAMRANMSEPEIGERKVVEAAFSLPRADRLDDAGLGTGIQTGMLIFHANDLRPIDFRNIFNSMQL